MQAVDGSARSSFCSEAKERVQSERVDPLWHIESVAWVKATFGSDPFLLGVEQGDTVFGQRPKRKNCFGVSSLLTSSQKKKKMRIFKV